MSGAITWRGESIARPSLTTLALEHSYSRAWYRDSGESIEDYAASLGLAPAYVCDVVAILSPRVSVAQNARLAQSYLETGKVPGAMRQRLNALAKYETSGLFNGPKVNAFSAALRGDETAVVIDAWMVRLLMPDLTGKSIRVKAYRQCAALVRGTASMLGWQPAETQAALWSGCRALVGYQDPYGPLLMQVAQ